MRKLIFILSLLFILLPSGLVSAQDTVSLTCQKMSISYEGRWTVICGEEDSSEYSDYCQLNTSFKVGESYCLPVRNDDLCFPMAIGNRWDKGVLHCLTGSSPEQNYCCNLDESILVASDLPLDENRLFCTDANSKNLMLGKTKVQAILDAKCNYVQNSSVFEYGFLCDEEHKCIIDDTEYYCCGGFVPPGEDPPIETNPTESFRGCGDITEREEREACERCVGTRKDPRGAVWTEIGCIDPSPAGLITRIFQIGLGIMGGIAVLRFIHIAIMYQSGDAQKIQDAREGVISLITGIIILSLGVVILQFLGINILGLPAGFLGG